MLLVSIIATDCEGRASASSAAVAAPLTTKEDAHKVLVADRVRGHGHKAGDTGTIKSIAAASVAAAAARLVAYGRVTTAIATTLTVAGPATGAKAAAVQAIAVGGEDGRLGLQRKKEKRTESACKKVGGKKQVIKKESCKEEARATSYLASKTAHVVRARHTLWCSWKQVMALLEKM